MTALDVENLQFRFEAGWSVIKWDDDDAFQKGIQRLTGSKAVDLLAVNQRMVALVEVKDFRHPEADWGRVKTGALAEEVSIKVRDSLAGIVGAARRIGAEPWGSWATRLHTCESLRVVLWLERPSSHYEDPRRKDELAHFRDRLKQRLSWLTSDVFICSQHERVRLPGVTAEDLPPPSAQG